MAWLHKVASNGEGPYQWPRHIPLQREHGAFPPELVETHIWVCCFLAGPPPNKACWCPLVSLQNPYKCIPSKKTYPWLDLREAFQRSHGNRTCAVVSRGVAALRPSIGPGCPGAFLLKLVSTSVIPGDRPQVKKTFFEAVPPGVTEVGAIAAAALRISMHCGKCVSRAQETELFQHASKDGTPTHSPQPPPPSTARLEPGPRQHRRAQGILPAAALAKRRCPEPPHFQLQPPHQAGPGGTGPLGAMNLEAT